MENNEEEDSAVWNYNNALYHFLKSGRTAQNEKILLRAYKCNAFVIDYMLGVKEMPVDQPQHIGLGDENEAVSYVYGAWPIWDKNEEALDWLYEFKQKRSRLN